MSTVTLQDLLADCQPDAGAGILFASVESLENNENALGVLWGDADPIVLYGEGPTVAISVGRDMNAGSFVPSELDRISNEVLEQLTQLRAVSHHRREGIVGHHCTALLHIHL